MTTVPSPKTSAPPTRLTNARRRTDYGGSKADYPKLGAPVSAHHPFCGPVHQ